MAYCINCGEKVSEDAYFCPKCGAKTQRGIEANVTTPDDLREAFRRAGVEFEKAFLLMAKEMHTAFQKATENTQKTVQSKAACSNCGAKMSANAIYCPNCGKKQQKPA